MADPFEFLEFARGRYEAGGGWRFVLSGKFRARTRERRRRSDRLSVTREIAGGALAVALSLTAVAVLGWLAAT